jgi:hypothetical protein
MCCLKRFKDPYRFSACRYARRRIAAKPAESRNHNVYVASQNAGFFLLKIAESLV